MIKRERYENTHSLQFYKGNNRYNFMYDNVDCLSFKNLYTNGGDYEG